MEKKIGSLLIIPLVLVAFTLSSCTKKVPLTEDQKSFAGKWVAVDGTYVQIYLNGGGELKMSNTSITGGSATIADNSLTIGMGPIKKTMQITQKPKLVGGKWVMKLDTIEYVRQ